MINLILYSGTKPLNYSSPSKMCPNSEALLCGGNRAYAVVKILAYDELYFPGRIFQKGNNLMDAYKEDIVECATTLRKELKKLWVN